jgi:hypothetical protein
MFIVTIPLSKMVHHIKIDVAILSQKGDKKGA